MSALRDKTETSGTADNPGVVELEYLGNPLSRVAAWSEDGDYVIRSLEYDVMAAHDDLYQAVSQFVVRTTEYASVLADSDDPEDRMLALMIYRRLGAIATAVGRPVSNPPRRRGGLIGRVRKHRGQSAAPGWSLHHAALS